MALSDDERPLVTAGLGTLCRPSTAQSWTAGATPGYYGRVVAESGRHVRTDSAAAGLRYCL
jgi:hypothetical protein